ncbi:MAG: YeeE/YedE family protein [Candidatus Odinarchaeota archaeon]
MDFWYTLIAGLIIGAIFGFILQRGRFCMNSAFRDIILLKEYKLAKAVAVSLVVLMVGFAIFAFAGVIDLNPRIFKPAAAIVGGLVFGIGMVLAAGCASGTTYRVGEGMIGSFVAAIGLTFGAVITSWGILSGAKTYLQDFGQSAGEAALTLFGEFDETLTPVLMLVVGLIGIVLMLIFWTLPALKKRREANEPLIKFENFKEATFKKAYPWWTTGILIGLILTAGYIASNGVVGITGGWRQINQWFISYENPAASILWPGFIIFGIILGSFLSAYMAGEFKLRIPKDGATLLKQFLGGILMGFGAITAMGCNITNILGGVPQLSLHSILAGLCIMIGCWIAAYLLFMRKED